MSRLGDGAVCRAAVVSGVEPLELRVFTCIADRPLPRPNHAAPPFEEIVYDPPFSEQKTVGTWHYKRPERNAAAMPGSEVRIDIEEPDERIKG